MKKLLVFGIAMLALPAAAQTAITFNGCRNLFEDQNFLFSNTGTDTYNKKIYITTPVTGDQQCGGVGICEFKIQWNNALTRWEFLADTGNGDFVNPYLIYYNSTGNSAASNPPSNTFGTWVENIAVTAGECGGNLTAANSTFSGDVHNSSLATVGTVKDKIQLFPNPVLDLMTISGVVNAKGIQIFSVAGQLLKTMPFTEKINVGSLRSGVYILKVVSADSSVTELKFIKN